MSCAVETLGMVTPLLQMWLTWTSHTAAWWAALVRPLLAWRQPRVQPVARARAMYLRAVAQFEGEDIEAAVSLAHAARDLYERTDDREGLGRAERLIGEVLARLQVYDAAAEAYRCATIAFKLPENDAETLVELAEVARLQGDLDAAHDAYRQALRLYTRLGDQLQAAQITQRLGFLLYEQERWSEAEAAYRDALQLAETLNLAACHASLYLEIGNAIAQQGRIDEAQSLFEHSVAQVRANNDEDTLADALHSLAMTYAHAGQPDEAFPLYRESLALNSRTGDRVGMAYTLYELGVLEGGRGQTWRAERHLKAALEIFEAEGVLEAEVTRWTLDDLGTALDATAATHQHQPLPSVIERPLTPRLASLFTLF